MPRPLGKNPLHPYYTEATFSELAVSFLSRHHNSCMNSVLISGWPRAQKFGANQSTRIAKKQVEIMTFFFNSESLSEKDQQIKQSYAGLSALGWDLGWWPQLVLKWSPRPRFRWYWNNPFLPIHFVGRGGLWASAEGRCLGSMSEGGEGRKQAVARSHLRLL